jgi:hypothetical protein
MDNFNKADTPPSTANNSPEYQASQTARLQRQRQRDRSGGLFGYLAAVSILFSGVFAAVGFYSWTLLAQVGGVNNNEVRNSVAVHSKPISAPVSSTEKPAKLSVAKMTLIKSKVSVPTRKANKTVPKVAKKAAATSKTQPKKGSSQKIAKVAAPASKKARVLKKPAKLSPKRPYPVKRRVPPPQFFVEDEFPVIEGPEFIEPF